MSLRITGLQPGACEHLRAMTDEDLIARGARRCTVTDKPGSPDRVELRDLETGESALLVNYVHQSADTPYRASHAIFIGERSTLACDAMDVVPGTLRLRPPSLRAFDAAPMLNDARLAAGREVEAAIEALLADERTAYIPVYFARPGCYAARIERA